MHKLQFEFKVLIDSKLSICCQKQFVKIERFTHPQIIIYYTKVQLYVCC